MADVRHRAVQGDSVADVNVEAVLPVGLVDPVSVGHREGLPLFAVTCGKRTLIHRPDVIKTSLVASHRTNLLYGNQMSLKINHH